MEAWVAWWVVSTLLGLIAIPYCSAAFGNVPDRGWCFARPAGLLMTSYVLWLAGVTGVLPNGRGAVLLAAGVVAMGALLILRGQRDHLRALVRSNGRALLAYEVMYLAAFAGLALLRAYVPELNSTEKPMDLAMLNSVMRSPTLPPLDPWLSGYTVNYYYFGYLMMGVLSQLSGAAAAVGFNLALAYVFATAAVAAMGLVANLVVLLGRAEPSGWRISAPALRAGVLGSAVLLLGGNALAALEFLRAHGFSAPDLWRWLSIKQGDDGAGRLVMLGLPPDLAYQSATWYPTENWWWWRSTRLVDSVVQGRSTDYTITEFPFFSFLLGDLHPHVMSLPFGLLALGVCLAAFYRVADPGVWLREHRMQALMTALVLGSLGFINGWDLGPYFALFLATLAARTWIDHGATARPWGRLLTLAALFGVAMLVGFGLFYLPLILQVLTTGAGAGGESKGLPIALWQGPSTRPLHFMMFWLAAIGLCSGFLMVAMKRGLGRGAAVALPFLTMVLVFLAGSELWRVLNAEAAPEANPMRLVERFWLLVPLSIALGVLLRRPGDSDEVLPGVNETPNVGVSDAVRFVAGLLAGAMTLLLVCELVYVRDVFGNRMNTVFKLWYQAWTWLAVAGAFGLAYVRGFINAR